MIKRRFAREYCLQVLYILEISSLTVSDLSNIIATHTSILEPDLLEFYKKLLDSTIGSINEINKTIKSISLNWEMDRMAATDKCILRMAVCEMRILKHAPVAVIINEAIELAKKYSTEKSGKFINGILDHIAKSAINESSDKNAQQT
jgi:transcription antitermination factor NusB